MEMETPPNQQLRTSLSERVFRCSSSFLPLFRVCVFPSGALPEPYHKQNKYTPVNTSTKVSAANYDITPGSSLMWDFMKSSSSCLASTFENRLQPEKDGQLHQSLVHYKTIQCIIHTKRQLPKATNDIIIK